MVGTDSSITVRTISVIKKCTSCTRCPSDAFAPETWDEPLTGSHFQLSMVDLTYILLEIENEFSVRISSEDLADYGFNTVRKICSAVRKQLK